ncbi:Peptidase propeptide and YPEB domain-containing protein [Opitutus sp. GAS368]|nr:Peptidase propeptide and YPEB domain-containing protein [Opitutus sp. GAS368]
MTARIQTARARPGEQPKRSNPMKRKLLLPALLLCSALFVNHAFAEQPDNKKNSTPPPELLAQAKITEAEARTIALVKVPGGKVVSAELEKEHGRVIWSLDLATPDTKDITEVAVNAKTGTVISVKVESARDEAKEKAEDEKDEKK